MSSAGNTKPGPLKASYFDLPLDLRRRAIGWNTRTWERALLNGLEMLDANGLQIDGMKTLEIGAGPKSSLSPLFAALGADATSSYYLEETGEGASRLIDALTADYGFEVKRRKLDLFDPLDGAKFDLVICKSILGGVSLGGDVGGLSKAVGSIMGNLMKPTGYFLTLDNLEGSRLSHFARNKIGAGRDRWYYFTLATLKDAMPAQTQITQNSSAVLSFGRYPVPGLNSLFSLLDDTLLDRMFPNWHTVGTTLAWRQ